MESPKEDKKKKIYNFDDYWKKIGIVNDYKKIISDKKEDFRKFIIKFKKELDNTSVAKDILIKYVTKKDVTEDELKFFRKQVVEVIKSLGIGIPVIIIPFGMALLAFIMWLSNHYKIDILPSYLKKDEE